MGVLFARVYYPKKLLQDQGQGVDSYLYFLLGKGNEGFGLNYGVLHNLYFFGSNFTGRQKPLMVSSAFGCILPKKATAGSVSGCR